MEVGQKVRVIKRGLLTTGREGVITEVRGHLAVVKVEGVIKELTYRKASLRIINDVPKPKEDKFEIIEVEELEVKNNQYVCLVFRDKDGLYKTNRYHIKDSYVNNEDKTLKVGAGWGKVAFDKIKYIIPLPSRAVFAKPEPNVFPFWIHDGDVKNLLIATITVKGGHELMAELEGNITYPFDWISDVDKEKFKPKFKVTEKRVLKEGAFDDDEVGENIKALMRDGAIQARTKGMSFGAIFQHKTTKEVKIQNEFSRPCHAMMRSMDRNFDTDKFGVKFGIQYLNSTYFSGKKEDQELFKRYTIWVMNESPWAQYILTKDWDEAVDYGIKVRTDIPSNAMMCTFYALRYPTEYSDRIRKWAEFVDKGMNPAVAFFGADTMSFEKDTSGHHQLLDTHVMNLQDLIDFAQCKEGKVKTKPYNETYDYNNVSAHHGSVKEWNELKGDTAIKSLRGSDIFTGKTEVRGFDKVKQIDYDKLIKLTNELIG